MKNEKQDPLGQRPPGTEESSVKLPTAIEMKNLDRSATDIYQIPSIVLMENAGLGTVKMIEHQLGPCTKTFALIFVGPGNNGGDGLVIGRHLHQRGCQPVFFFLVNDYLLQINILPTQLKFLLIQLANLRNHTLHHSVVNVGRPSVGLCLTGYKSIINGFPFKNKIINELILNNTNINLILVVINNHIHKLRHNGLNNFFIG